MAIHRGIQSVIFYYLACTPCAETRVRKQRKREAARSRLERQLLEEEQPDLYRHPSPSSTNPHWQTEIALGPALAVRGKRRANHLDEQRRRKVALGDNASGEPSSIDLPEGACGDDRHDSSWNFRVYQREDEELWGSATHLDGSSLGDGLTRPQRVLTRDSLWSSHQGFRNPPINELHPATVTKVNSREEVMWMMQPPPVAEVMSGKERATRSRSDSGGSRTSPSESTLSAQLSNRLAQSLSRNAEVATSISRENSNRVSNNPVGQRQDISANISERDFAVNATPGEAKEKRRPLPLRVPHGPDQVSSSITQLSSLAAEPINMAKPRQSASRPHLSTIASDEANNPSVRHLIVRSEQDDTSKENELPATAQGGEDSLRGSSPGRRPAPLVLSEASVVKVVGELTPGSLHGRIIRAQTSPDFKHGGGLWQRQAEHDRDDGEDMTGSIQPEVFDQYDDLPEWVHEHTKREVKQRWSMDL